MILHQRPLRTIYDILSLTDSILIADTIQWCTKKTLFPIDFPFVSLRKNYNSLLLLCPLCPQSKTAVIFSSSPFIIFRQLFFFSHSCSYQSGRDWLFLLQCWPPIECAPSGCVRTLILLTAEYLVFSRSSTPANCPHLLCSTYGLCGRKISLVLPGLRRSVCRWTVLYVMTMEVGSGTVI